LALEKVQRNSQNLDLISALKFDRRLNFRQHLPNIALIFSETEFNFLKEVAQLKK
jgi:hypothetical protein